MKSNIPHPRILILSFLFLVSLYACSDGGSSTQVDEIGTETPGGTEVVPLDPATIQLEWESGAHSETYVVAEDGTNNTCARCHAPIVWVPTLEDMPESCASCKFEVEEPPPFLLEDEWRPIECHVCHEPDGDEVSPEIAWLEIAQIEEYEEVTGVDELCHKCHVAADILGHTSVVVGGDHDGYSCTQCHGAHSTAASCSSDGCHSQMPEPIVGHDQAHAEVLCVACHDASGLEVGPETVTLEWTTFIPSEAEGGLRPFTSHTTQTFVDCERCHYAGNPWGLSEVEVPVNQ